MPVDLQSSLASLLRSFAMVALVVQLAKRGLKDGSCCLQNRGSVIPSFGSTFLFENGASVDGAPVEAVPYVAL